MRVEITEWDLVRMKQGEEVIKEGVTLVWVEPTCSMPTITPSQPQKMVIKPHEEQK